MAGKMANDADKPYNSFILDQVYVDPLEVFRFRPKSLQDVLGDALIVLDTNALLVPFGTGKESLAQVRKTFGELAEQKRLVVPSQVAREFAENRPEKLKTLYQQVSRKRSVAAPEVHTYPLLESSTSYKKLQAAEKELSDKVLEYRKALTSVLRDLESWHWDDPVSTLYREIIGPEVVVRLNHDEATTSVEWQRRIVHRLPPGYKDKGKPDTGIGDFLVWLTILQVGRERNKDAIFVSGDEKSDWWYQSENTALYPRFELLEEYRRETNGCTFHMIRFAELLERFGASPAIVREVKEESARPLVAVPPVTAQPHEDREFGVPRQAELAVAQWIETFDKIEANASFPDYLSSRDPTVGYEIVLVHAPDGPRLLRRLDQLTTKRRSARLRELSVVFVTLPKQIDWLSRKLRGARLPFSVHKGVFADGRFTPV